MIKRIIQIREQEGLSQEKFAKKIGLSRNFINQAENEKKNLSDRTINDICKTFQINPEWLRYGVGEMKTTKPLMLAEYLGQILNGDDDFIEDLIGVYMELDPTSKDAIKLIAQKMSDKQKMREP